MYPRELFVTNENITRQNIAKYEAKQKLWYDTAEKLYSDYFKMNLKERLTVEEEINKAVGFKK